MNLKMKLLTPVIACLLCAANAAAPVQAAETAPEEKQIILSLYDDFEPVGDDMICVKVPANKAVKVDITQHSPERANLLLYSITLETPAQQKFYFPVDPGDYTLTVSTAPTADGFLTQTLSTDYSILSADYSAEPRYYTATLCTCNLRITSVSGDTEPAEPALTVGTAMCSNELLSVAHLMQFQAYARRCGDYNNDGEISLDDAIGVMTEYNLREVLGDTEDICDAETLAASDTDGDGRLSLSDAVQIMKYNNYVMMGEEPDWETLLEE